MAAPGGHYGPLPKPEGQTRIEVAEQPVQAARACFNAWDAIAWRSGFGKVLFEFHEPRLFDTLYDAAAAHVKPHAKAFKRLRPGELEEIIAMTDTPYWQGRHSRPAGFFLSALLNETDLPELVGTFGPLPFRGVYYDVLGWRLAPGKRLGVQGDSHIKCLGRHAQGLLVNYGHAQDFAWDACGGVQANYGSGGNFADGARAGVQLNYGSAYAMADGAVGGIQVDIGVPRVNQVARPASGGIQVYLGPYAVAERLPSDGDSFIGQCRDLIRFKGLASPSEALAALGAYRWSAFERDMKRLARKHGRPS
jgi:hypothetical protein